MSETENTSEEDITQINTESEVSKEQVNPKISPIKIITWAVLFVCVLLFVWYVKADRHTPYTDQARIQQVILPITPRISGHITKVNVRLHSKVKVGDTLFEIDKRPLYVALRKAEADVDNAAQQIGAGNADVKSAVSNVGVAKASLDRAQRNFDRMEKVYTTNPGAVSQADRDRVETSLDQAVEKLASSKANLEKSQQKLGDTGPENPQLRAAVTALEKAQLDIKFATIIAEADGFIESFNVEEGYYCSAGQPLATFISYHDVWIQADMRENNLSNIKPGDKVEFVLDVAPGQVFESTVSSVGYGVSAGNEVNRGGLPSVGSSSSWLREPQRFPVIITINNSGLWAIIRTGGQVDVVVYTGEHSFLNPIAHFQIWLVSKLSYVR